MKIQSRVVLLLTLCDCGNETPDGGLEGFGDASTTADASSDTRDPSTGDAVTSTGVDGSGTSTGGSPSTGTGDDDPTEPLYDVGLPDVPPQICDEGDPDATVYSYIWIANTSQFPATVSKIDTATMVEEGRYPTRPDYEGSPSRTSVNQNGDAAVANRHGGVTKYYARRDDCIDRNGIPGIQTSSGGNDVLLFPQEDCIAWHTPLDYESNRPVAWTRGVWNASSCRYENNMLWTAGSNGPGQAEVLLLDGDTGTVQETIPIPEITADFGLYGGAVDGEGNFWAIEAAGARLVRVDRQSFEYDVWSVPEIGGYGITVDAQGRPWVCAATVYRFDPTEETWDFADVDGGAGGCMTDGDRTLWLANDPLLGIDTETFEVVHSWDLPTGIRGVSVDFDGRVWAIPPNNSAAFRVNPADGTYDVFDGLSGAYTYSDMTGFALEHAGIPAG